MSPPRPHLHRHRAGIAPLPVTEDVMTRSTLPVIALLAAVQFAPALAHTDPTTITDNTSVGAVAHLGSTSGGGPEVHRPEPIRNWADMRQAPHLDNTTDGPTPHIGPTGQH